MNKYKLTLSIIKYKNFEVYANSEKEAVEKASNEYLAGNILFDIPPHYPPTLESIKIVEKNIPDEKYSLWKIKNQNRRL